MREGGREGGREHEMKDQQLKTKIKTERREGWRAVPICPSRAVQSDRIPLSLSESSSNTRSIAGPE